MANTESYKTIIRFPIPYDIFDYSNIFVLDYINMILTNGLVSRLFKALRLHLGSIYSISSTLHLNPVDKKYQNFYNIIGAEPKIGSSNRLVNYIRQFDDVRKPLSDFDKEFAEKIGW